MSAEVAFIRSWRVGRFRVELSCPKLKPSQVSSVRMEWLPHVPQRLTETDLVEYRAGRDAAVRDMASELGVTVGVLDL